jgi:hypothetical protein
MRGRKRGCAIIGLYPKDLKTEVLLSPFFFDLKKGTEKQQIDAPSPEGGNAGAGSTTTLTTMIWRYQDGKNKTAGRTGLR